MSKFFQTVKKLTSLESRLLLCFLLPPLGIFLLLLSGLNTIGKNLKEQRNFVFSLSSFLFLCLFISTIGAAISMKEINYLCISAMILGYWGLYIRILESEKNQLLKHFRWIMIFGGVYSCVIGWISQVFTLTPAIGYLTGTVLFAHTDFQNYKRLIGCEYNPNFAVFILLLANSFVLAYLLASLRSKRLSRFLWLIPILLILSCGVLQTGSRAGFVALLLIYLLFILRFNPTLFILGMILVLAGSKWLIHLMPRNASIKQSVDVRMDIWKSGYEIWKDHPFFGVTPMGFSRESLKHFNLFEPHAHNILIGMFAEYGTLGGLAFILVICVNLLKCAHLFFFIQNKKCILESFLFGLPIIILTGVFDEPLFSPQIGVIAVILLACWDRFTKRMHYVLASPFISRLILSVFLFTKKLNINQK